MKSLRPFNLWHPEWIGETGEIIAPTLCTNPLNMMTVIRIARIGGKNDFSCTIDKYCEMHMFSTHTHTVYV